MKNDLSALEDVAAVERNSAQGEVEGIQLHVAVSAIGNLVRVVTEGNLESRSCKATAVESSVQCAENSIRAGARRHNKDVIRREIGIGFDQSYQQSVAGRVDSSERSIVLAQEDPSHVAHKLKLGVTGIIAWLQPIKQI